MTDVDLGSPESIRDPAGYFARARTRGGDVQWSDVHRAWVVLSHAEVERAFRDTETLSADRTATFQRAAARHSPAFAQVTELLAGWMIFRDDPAHRRLREPVRAAFTPRAVSALEAEIRAIVERAIDAFPDDTVELHEAFARPIPALVIGALLGADPADRIRFQGWSDEIAAIVFSLEPRSVREERVVPAARQFVAFFERLIERERASPSGNLLSALVRSPVGELSPLELVGACTLLLFAGHETTTTLLGARDPPRAPRPAEVAPRAPRRLGGGGRGVPARRGPGAHHGSEGRHAPHARRPRVVSTFVCEVSGEGFEAPEA